MTTSRGLLNSSKYGDSTVALDNLYLFTPSAQIVLFIDKTPFSSPGWTFLALSAFPHKRCSSPKIIFVALHWTLSNMSMSPLYWVAQNWTQHFQLWPCHKQWWRIPTLSQLVMLCYCSTGCHQDSWWQEHISCWNPWWRYMETFHITIIWLKSEYNSEWESECQIIWESEMLKGEASAFKSHVT